MRKLHLTLISLFFASLFSIPSAYAPQDIDITQVPEAVGESFGIPAPNTAFVGGLFMSGIVFLALVLPTLLLRNKAPALIMSFLVLTFLVSINWLPIWVMIMITVIVTGAMSRRIKRWFS